MCFGQYVKAKKQNKKNKHKLPCHSRKANPGPLASRSASLSQSFLAFTISLPLFSAEMSMMTDVCLIRDFLKKVFN